ncbi:hypothetical protein O3P69_015178 [Scylla paramamosain]|uniref:HTH psq-type domain-containing protein n=1 Tax=Scylla paramamosain TaxID=85552 RepID=A0AAW0T463_SCYPA
MASTQRYTQEQVERAVKLVRSKKMSLIGASKDFGIPYATFGGKRQRKIISMTGAKHLYSITSGTRQQVTMLTFSFAMGQYLPLLLIFPYTRDPRFNALESPSSNNPACPTVPAFHIPACPTVAAFHMPKFQNDWRLPHTALIPEEKGIEKDHCSIAILNKWC